MRYYNGISILESLYKTLYARHHRAASAKVKSNVWN
jgi:hypothetical protein